MNAYLTFKALHLIAVISLDGGLALFAQNFVYHRETKDNIGQSETKLMEKKDYIFTL